MRLDARFPSLQMVNVLCVDRACAMRATALRQCDAGASSNRPSPHWTTWRSVIDRDGEMGERDVEEFKNST